MLLFRLLLISLSLLGILPIIKSIIGKKDFNVWELVMFFSSFFFCIIPAISGNNSYKWLKGFEYDGSNFILYLFVVGTYVLSLRFINIIWKKKHSKEYDIINITHYIKNYPLFKHSKYIYALFSIVLIIGFIFYIPMMSMFMKTEEFSLEDTMSYETRIYVSIFEYIFTLCYTLLFFLYFRIKPGKQKIIIGIFILLFLAETILLPRRTLLLYLIIGFIILYSIKRELFNFKFYLRSLIVVLFIWLIYFPFYNVMRTTSYRFDVNKPIESVTNVIDDAINRWDDDNQNAKEVSEGRSLNLFYALYRLIETDQYPTLGKVYLSCIDYAVPKIINPSKGEGPDGELERRMELYNDQADSYLLYSYADFHLLGGFLCSLYICIAIFIYKIIFAISNFFVRNSLIDILLISEFVSLSWNVEGKISGSYIYLFRIFIPIIIVFLFKLLIKKNKSLIN